MAKGYPHVISALKEHPWLIRESALETILMILDRRLAGDRLTPEEMQQALEQRRRDRDNIRESVPEAAQGVGVLPLYGPIFPKANLFTEFSGGTSIEEFQQEFRALLNNDQVTSILLDVDTPGGSAYMIPEMADEIYAARKIKPVVAVANPETASAGLFLATQASKFYSTPSGMVGSLGTIAIHDDISEMQNKLGVKTTFIHAGKYKAELAPERPLTDSAKDYVQGIVNELNDRFVKSVARGRGTSVKNVAENYGEGRMLTAQRAEKVGMIDGVATFDEVLGDLLSNGGKPSGSKQRATRLRSSYDKELEHSEPGSGLGEPLPRTPPDDEDIDTWQNGERFDDPLQTEGYAMNREQLLAIANRLGISNAEKLEDDELSTKVAQELETVLENQDELTKAIATANEQRAFAEAYPEQAAKLAELEEKGRKADASEYASSFTRLKDSEGNETQHGLSIPVRQLIEGCHLKLSQGSFSADDLTELINMLASRNAVIEFGEKGSSRQGELESVAVPETRQEARKLFADKVRELMTEDNLDRKAAMQEAAKRYPELAEAYANK